MRPPGSGRRGPPARRCRDAHQARGRQLWPIASHAEHRLALEAPAVWAAAVLVPDAGHLGLGPLAEVAASTHRWADLVPHAPAGPVGVPPGLRPAGPRP